MIWPGLLGPLLALASAILLWGVSLSYVDPRHMTDLGLVSVLPPATYVSFAIVTISYCLVIHRPYVRTPRLRSGQALIPLLHVIVLVIMIHGAPAILYGALRYSWAWKHVGMVNYIQRHGSVNPHISVLGAYHNWPGFFALNALITEVAGSASALSFAAWAPVFFNLLNLGALLLIFETFTRDRRLIWLSVWFFYLTNWVGQDYFSPQALNYFLHLIILGICLRWFRVATLPPKSTIKRWLRFDRVASLFHGFASRAARSEIPNVLSRPFQRTGLKAIVILLFAAVVSSHQLTPIMTISALVALVVFQRCNAYSLPILMILLLIIWYRFGAWAFLHGEIESLTASTGQVTDHIDSNLIDLSRASAGQRLVAVMGRRLSALLWGLAFLGGVRRLLQGYWDLSVVLLIIAPFAALVGNSYGGEILFRVYLFTVPFAAFFAAALLYPSPASSKSWWTTAITVLLSGAMLVGFFFAYFGKERQYYFTRNEVDAAQYLYDVAPAGSLLIEGTRNYPAQFQNYEFYTYVAISREPPESRLEVVAHPVETLSRWMDNDKYAAIYLIITRSQKAENDALGKMPSGSLERIEQALMQSPKFQIIYENEDARIFTLGNGANGAEQ